MEQPGRRAALKKLLIGVGVVIFARVEPAWSQTNPTLRRELKYRDPAKSKHHCGSCVHFHNAGTLEGRGRCELITDDDEISASGVCDLWTGS
jgi:hypothetical protein